MEVAHVGWICCIQDFLKEKDEVGVSEEQCWERLKRGRLPHPWVGPAAAQSTQHHPEESAPKSRWGFAASPSGCQQPWEPPRAAQDSGSPWIGSRCWCLPLSSALPPVAKYKVIVSEEAALMTDDGLDCDLPSPKSYCLMIIKQ